MDKKVSKKISYLYFVMTLLIIGIHSVSQESLGFSGNLIWINRIFRILYDSATGSFFFFSALLLFRKERSYYKLIAEKIKTLLVPYIIYNLLLFCYRNIVKAVLFDHTTLNFRAIDVLRSVVYSTADPPLWFLRVLFCFILLYPIINVLCRNLKLGLCLIVASFVFHLFIGVDSGYSTIHYWLPIYATGAVVGKHFEKRFYMRRPGTCSIGCGIVLILFLILADNHSYLYYLYRFIAPFLLWYVFEFTRDLPEASWWMKCTLFYYGMHVIVTSPVTKVYRILAHNNSVVLILAHVLIPSACVCVLGLVAAIIRLAIPGVWKILLGGRDDK